MTQDILDLDQFDYLTPDELGQLLATSSGRFSKSFPLSSIGSTQDPADIAIDYLHGALFGETLARHCEDVSVEVVREGHSTSLKFLMLVKNITSFAEDYHRLQSLPGLHDDDELEFDLSDEIMAFECNMFDREFRMPLLGDNYIANFLNGSDYLDNKKYWHKRFRSWKWGFWKSFASPKLGVDLYISTDQDRVWIVPAGRQTAEKLLANQGGFSAADCRLSDAVSLRIDRHPHMLVSPDVVVRIPTVNLERAVRCWNACLAPSDWTSESTREIYEGTAPAPAPAPAPPELEPPWKARWEEMEERIARAEAHARSNWEHRLSFTWGITEDGEAITCGNELVTIVAFLDASDRMRPSLISNVLLGLESGSGLLRRQLGMELTEQCDLNKLTPEQFEALCYEILLRCGKFDEKTARRHGKTKSRDGGRDIELWSRPRMGRPSIKWIFQCKHITNHKALGASRITVSDVIDQYNASGFGVMTNEAIDSTLYDRLDAISGRRGILIDTWDGNHLKRFLAPRTDLIHRYFPHK